MTIRPVFLRLFGLTLTRSAAWHVVAALVVTLLTGGPASAQILHPFPAKTPTARSTAITLQSPEAIPGALPPSMPPLANWPGAAQAEPWDVAEAAGLSVLLPSSPQPQAAQSFIAQLKGNDAALEVIVGQGRILTTREDISAGRGQPLIAVGDPSVVEFAVLNSRQLRLTAQRIGVTDLTITTANNRTFSYEIRAVADLAPLEARLREAFPDASLRLAPLRNQVIVEGQARDSQQVDNVLRTIQVYLESIEIAQLRKIQGQRLAAGPGQPVPGPDAGQPGVPPPPTSAGPGEAPTPGATASPELAAPLQVEGTVAPIRVINLIRVPGSQQVLLKVRVAELNRSALRNIGSDFLGIDRNTGAIIGTQIANPVTAAGAIGQLQLPQITTGRKLGGATLLQSQALGTNGGTTVFGIFQGGNFEFMLNALRSNSMLKILAEPNLVALSGHQASFLAGGEFPVPVPQVSASGVAPTVTVQFKPFGVKLNFVPSILDGDIIRLAVAPEVSQVDFSIAVTLVAGGTPVPGLNVRRAQTTVELRSGQTLAIAGLLQLQLNGTTARIPGLGDLPILGPFFSNTTGQRVEKELVVLVTPYLIEPMNRNQVPPTPGDEVKEPNDLEFFLTNRIEGRTGRDFRSTTAWDDPLHLLKLLKLERKYVSGPSGFSD